MLTSYEKKMRKDNLYQSYVSDIINSFGGLTSMSKIIDVPIPTIFGWKKLKNIPSWRVKNIIDKANEHSIKLPSSFIES